MYIYIRVSFPSERKSLSTVHHEMNDLYRPPRKEGRKKREVAPESAQEKGRELYM